MLVYTKEHLALMEALNLEETRAFISFLKSELLRHKEDIEETEKRIKLSYEHIKELKRTR